MVDCIKILHVDFMYSFAILSSPVALLFFNPLIALSISSAVISLSNSVSSRNSGKSDSGVCTSGCSSSLISLKKLLNTFI